MGKSKNPLSQARGKQKAPENIWFRRSGAGHALFVEYYARQPVGTVVSGTPELMVQDQTTKSKLTSSRPDVGQGLSRAAKRRKKKKGISQASSNTTAPVEQQVEPSAAAATSSSSPSMVSPLIQAYQKFIKSEEKETCLNIQAFLSAMSRPLPLTIRLRQSTEDTDQLCSDLQEFRDIVQPSVFDPLIYQAKGSKQAVGQQSPEFKQFLVDASQHGELARQELGSMLPVIALTQVGAMTRSSWVLDMCASPGSKTLQALEVIGPKGRIVANDVLESRLDALKAAVERAGMPESLTKRITYSCQDATQLVVNASKQWDAAICDVPCSGDGTCRKDKHILPMFKPNHGNNLHETQLKILLRALKWIKVGGIVCYSTCSLSPVEDEAVVCAALEKLNGDDHDNPTVELLKWKTPKGFIGRPGISTWKVADYTSTSADSEDEIPRLSWYESYSEAEKADMEGAVPTMWPPKETGLLNLERCIRLFPQDQDTGGFFVSLIRKLR